MDPTTSQPGQIRLRDVTALHAHPRRPFWSRDEQAHPFWGLIYVIRGRYVTETLGLVWSGGPGWLHTYAPGQSHRARFRPTGSAGRRSAAMLLQWSEDGGATGYPRVHFDTSRRLRTILEWLLDLHTHTRADRTAAERLLPVFLHELRRAAEHRQSLLPAVDVYTAEHLAAPIRVTELASVMGMSRSHFSRAFADLTGIPPRRYIARIRLARALELLTQTTRTCADVARATGFCSAAHLTRVCQQEMGKPPRQVSREEHARWL